MAKKKIDRTDTLLDFLKEIEKLKLIDREIYVSTQKRYENSAEHSWHLAMFVMLFEKDLAKELDQGKMLKMSLIHDLVEIYAGDTFFYDEKARINKREREKKAAHKLFRKLPNALQKDFNKIFDEFEENKTEEAKTVRCFDMLQPMLQNIISDGYSWKLHGITAQDIDRRKKDYMNHNSAVFRIYQKLLNEAKKKKLL